MLFRRAEYCLFAIVVVLQTGCNLELGSTSKKPVIPERSSPDEGESEAAPVAAAPEATPEPAQVEPPAVTAPARPEPTAVDRARWASTAVVLERIYQDLDDFAYGRVNKQFNEAECRAFCETVFARLSEARKAVEARAFPLDERLFMATMHLQSIVEMANPKHPTLGTNVRLNQYSLGKKKFSDEIKAVKLAMLE